MNFFFLDFPILIDFHWKYKKYWEILEKKEIYDIKFLWCDIIILSNNLKEN